MSALIKQAAVGKFDAWHNGHATLDIFELQLKWKAKWALYTARSPLVSIFKPSSSFKRLSVANTRS